MGSLLNRDGIAHLQWQQESLVFEFATRDAGLLSKAQLVFAPWRVRLSRPAHFRWHADRCPNSARWEVRMDSDVLVQDTPGQVLRTAEYGAVLKTIECSQRLSLHAALLTKNQRGVIIVGPCEAGKSTLACGLWQAGWSFLCDDVVLVDTGEMRAYPTARRVSLRNASRSLIGDSCWARMLRTPSCDQTAKGIVFHPHEVDGRERTDSTRVSAIVFLARRNASTGPAEVRRMDPAHALLALLPYSNFVRQRGPGGGIQGIQPLADAVPVFDLGRGGLAEMVQRVESFVDP